MARTWPTCFWDLSVESSLEQIKETGKRTKLRQGLIRGMVRLALCAQAWIAWRMLPREYPTWRTGYAYFCQWGKRPSEGEAEHAWARVKNALAWSAFALGG